jgi:hypothetical protein
MGNCHRCGIESRGFGFSMFNTQMICMDCVIEEKDHPDFKMARDEEYRQVASGNLNFIGVGLPEDLLKKYAETAYSPK